MAVDFERHVVLVSPRIHWNTGNAGRSCLGTGAFLHLVRPLGFSLESPEVKRAGLDYWESVQLRVWDDFGELESEMKPQPDEMAALSKTGHLPFWELPKGPQRLFLVFGSETDGLPDPIRNRFTPARTFHIPIRSDIRSLNLSTAVGIALYESLRGGPLFHAWPLSAQGPPV